MVSLKYLKKKCGREGLHEMFEEFRQTGLEVPPDDAFPMMLMEIKDKYEAMGGKSRPC